jgi:ABC-type multidrug transport system fused ATPase/permease subunit
LRLPSELQWLIKQVSPLLHWHVASFLCITAGSLLALLTPLILRWIIDQIIPQRAGGLVLLAVGLLFLGYQSRVALTALGNFLMLTSAQKMVLSLRMSLLRHLNTLSAEYFEDTPVGRLTYVLKEPIQEVSDFGSDFLPLVLRMVLTAVFTIIAMFFLSPVLTLAIVPFVPVFLLTRQYFRIRLGAAADTVQDEQRGWSQFIEEHLSSMVSIQILGQQRRQELRACQLLIRTLRSQHKQFSTGFWFAICSSSAIVAPMCVVIGYGCESVLKGTLSVGSLVAFYGFITQLFEPLSGASELYTRTQKSFASIRRLQATFALRPSVNDAQAAIYLPRGHSVQIDFAAVDFGYARQENGLHIPALRILPGEDIGIAGENGAGKSTLAKLMVRFYDPLQGAILLGGKDIRSIALRDLRQHLFYLPHSPALFAGTLASNLHFVQPRASDRELQEALECVGLWSFIAALPDGLGQRIGPGACQLSGGQRQRLAIARALLQKPDVLILDEATSCLDARGEAIVLQNIRSTLHTSTLVMISHRHSTLATFGRVLTLSNGRILSDSAHHLSLSAEPRLTTIFPIVEN